LQYSRQVLIKKENLLAAYEKIDCLESRVLNSASELFLRTFFAKIVLEPSYPSGLKEFSATTALYLINPFRLKQLKSSLNLSFNLRIILPLQSSFQQSLSLLQAFVFENMKEKTI